MLRSSLHPWASGQTLLRDGIAILLALVIGFGGLIFVFSQPDPFATLAPLTPLLAPADWPNSYQSISLGISAEGPWGQERGFHTHLQQDLDSQHAEILQTAIWHADPAEAAAHSNDLDRAVFTEQRFVMSREGGNRPASMLFCGTTGPDLPVGFRQCWYFAHWDHWYTEVNYRSNLEENLHFLEMQNLMARVDQLLMSAPEEPCYGIVCTGTK